MLAFDADPGQQLISYRRTPPPPTEPSGSLTSWAANESKSHARLHQLMSSGGMVPMSFALLSGLYRR